MTGVARPGMLRSASSNGTRNCSAMRTSTAGRKTRPAKPPNPRALRSPAMLSRTDFRLMADEPGQPTVTNLCPLCAPTSWTTRNTSFEVEQIKQLALIDRLPTHHHPPPPLKTTNRRNHDPPGNHDLFSTAPFQPACAPTLSHATCHRT